MLCRKPEREVVQHRREKTGFDDTENKTRYIQLLRRFHESHADRHQSPREHDPGEPGAGAEPMHHHVAGYFKHDVAEVKDPGGEAEHFRPHAEFLIHLQSGKANVRPIEVVDEPCNKDERHEAPRDLADELLFRRFVQHGTSRVPLMNVVHIGRPDRG